MASFCKGTENFQLHIPLIGRGTEGRDLQPAQLPRVPLAVVQDEPAGSNAWRNAPLLRGAEGTRQCPLLVKSRFIISILAVAIALSGCSTTRDVSFSSPVVTVPPWLFIEIRREHARPYRITFTGRDYTRREILAYLRTATFHRPDPWGIAIRPADKIVDFDRRHSAPLSAFARRHGIPVTYLDPGGNAIDGFIFSSTAHGLPFARLP